ncbi:MAG: hypothetical protein K2X09_04070 [Rickettsiales bacterium]|nr:hypothetical protein [Rickettsiales bacterium]
MTADNNFDQLLLDAAEQKDRKLDPTRIAQLKEGYDFFKESGLSDEQIKIAMALTGHEMRLIKQI